MKAKTRGLGCSTNLAILNASCSGGVGPDGKHSNPMLQAAELVKLEEGSRRASVESYCSNRRPSRRASRRTSRRRSSLRWSGRSSAASLQSSFNFNDSATSKGSMNMNLDFGESVNMMDFGVSQRLAVLDESLRGCIVDESIRSCASLDELDQLKEEFEFDNCDEEGREFADNLDGSIRSEGDLDDYVDSYGFMSWPSTTGRGREREVGTNGSMLNDPSVESKGNEDEEGNKTTSQASQESSSSSRLPSRRSVRRQSRRRSSRRGSHRWSGRSSVSSLGSSSNFSDSLISESGFMAWPSPAQKEVAGESNEVEHGTHDTIQEEHVDEVKREEEEWHIEDYENNTGESGQNQRCLSEGSSGSNAFAKTFQLFARVPSRRGSSSGPSQDGTTDLLKIKQMLLSAKNKEPGMGEVVEEDDKKKQGGSTSLISMFQQRLSAEMTQVEKSSKSKPQALASMNDESSVSVDGPTRRRSVEKAIWMRHNSVIDDDPDVYKKLYAQPPSEAMLRQSLNIFGRPKTKELRRGST